MLFLINYIFTIFVYTISSGLYQFYADVFYNVDNLNDWVRQKYEKPLDEVYDYIVVGAGTAGSIVASRLAEDPSHSILVIEAGGHPSSVYDIPIVAPLLQLTPYDWQYKTEPQKNSCWGLTDRKSIWPRGKVLGGSSRLNYMIYLRGHPRDFDSWISDNCKHWTSDEILGYFKKSENQKGRFINDGWHHSTEGLIPVSDLRHTSKLTEGLLDGAAELGFNVRQDLNGGKGEGFMAIQANIDQGARFSTDRLLHNKANLKVLTHAHVQKVLFHRGFEAYGVRFQRHGKMFTARARRTVILSAGAVGTPQILLLSGIGPKNHLQEHNIKVNVDLPVGENLQDHLVTGIDLVVLNISSPIGYKTMLDLYNPYNYLFNGDGPLTFPGSEVVGTIYSSLVKDARNSPPDIQFMALPGGLSSDAGVVLMKAMGISLKLWQEYFVHLVGSSVASLLPTILHPKSRGHIRLRSNNFLDHPLIDPKYLSHPEDIKVLVQGLQTVVQLANTTAMQRIGSTLYTRPLPGCEENMFGSPEYWECYGRHISGTAYHPVGTCKMGTIKDRTTVVDHFLRVHNTSRLRVIDASIMPSLPSANINAAVMMIAEKGADMIKSFWHLQRLHCHIREIFLKPEKSSAC